MPDPRETLARIRAQADAATEGPWSVFHGKRCGTYVTRPDLAGVAREWSLTWSDADAEFIAASRTTVPRLVDALQAVLALHQEDLFRGHLSNGCRICGHGPNDEGYPCATVTAITTELEALMGGSDRG